MNNFIFFTSEDYNLLIRLLMAHLFSDFLLQTKAMVRNKAWNSPGLLIHIAITMLMVLLFTGSINLMLIIGITHYIIDLSKTYFTTKYPDRSLFLFILDQALHVFIIFMSWMWYLDKYIVYNEFINGLLSNNKILLIAMGYIFSVWPSSFIVSMMVQRLEVAPAQDLNTNEKIANGGNWIGRFERVIIFTFVLLSQYEAIGFLITGKSIIRFADKEQLNTEYVLVGTMLSYTLAICAGALVNYLIGF